MPLVEGVRLPDAKSLTEPWLMPSCCAASVCVQLAADNNMRKLAVKILRLSEFNFWVDIVLIFDILYSMHLCSYCYRFVPKETKTLPQRQARKCQPQLFPQALIPAPRSPISTTPDRAPPQPLLRRPWHIAWRCGRAGQPRPHARSPAVPPHARRRPTDRARGLLHAAVPFSRHRPGHQRNRTTRTRNIPTMNHPPPQSRFRFQ